MIVVVLAAGSGNRLKDTLPKSFPYKTKSLIPINNEPAIKRLINQFLEIDNCNILLVLGHQYNLILDILNGQKQDFVLNKHYQKDSNLRSLFLGFKRILNDKNFVIDNGILVIEADSFFSNEILEKFIKYISQLNSLTNIPNKICWTTKGNANFNDSGGFIDPCNNTNNKNFGLVQNAYIKTKPNNSNTLKMYGMTWFDSSSIISWYDKAKLLLEGEDEFGTTGYFHEIIFKNSKKYYMNYYDLGIKALSFNNYSEYLKCKNLI